MKVTFIGLGNMGAGIAQCIQKEGFDLTVWNRTASKTEPFIANGAKTSSTIKDAVTGADVVLTSLMDDKSIMDNLQDDNGILSGMKSGAIHLCVTTISPECADQLNELHNAHGSHFISGPVVGRPDAAALGQLITFLAGNSQAISKVTPVCESYTKKVTALSDKPSVANYMKLSVNYNAVAILELLGENYAFAEKCGIPLEHVNGLYQMIFAHPALKMYAEKIKERDFAGRGGFVMTAGLKDVQMMTRTGDSMGVNLEIGKIFERKLKTCIEAGMGESDWSATYELTRHESGLESGLKL